jgi:hypothetical protein
LSQYFFNLFRYASLPMTDYSNYKLQITHLTAVAMFFELTGMCYLTEDR